MIEPNEYNLLTVQALELIFAALVVKTKRMLFDHMHGGKYATNISDNVTDGWMDGWTDGRMDGWIHVLFYNLICAFLKHLFFFCNLV